MLKLTERQREIFDFIKSYRSKQGTLPSRAEIARNFNWTSPTAPTKAVGVLITKGWLQASDNHLGYKLSEAYEDEMKKRSIDRLKKRISGDGM